MQVVQSMEESSLTKQGFFQDFGQGGRNEM